MIYAVITAGGVGSRMKLDCPKQFFKIKDKPLIAYTLQRFEEHPLIDSIVVVCIKSHINVMEDIVKKYNFKKISKIVPGGKCGQESIYNGLKSINNSIDDIVLIHDGNRPMVSRDIITNCIDVVIQKGNAISAIPCKEAMLIMDKESSSIASYPRNLLMRTQTPHGFYVSEIKRIHEIAQELKIIDSIASCTLYQSLSQRVYFSLGEESNIKITTPDDLSLFEALLETDK